jgi:YNFM family putative membrane transporter
LASGSRWRAADLKTRTDGLSHHRTDAPLPAHVGRGTSAFRRINLAVFSAGFSVFLLMYAVQPLLPVFAREFHVSPTTSSLALSLTTACLAMSMLVIGAIGEGWSRKSVMSLSLLAAAILTLLSSIVRDWPMFLLIRAIEGVTIAGLPALAMAYLGEEIHPDALGISMGIYVGSGALGGMTGRLLTGLFTDLFSWRPTLAGIGGIGLVAWATFSRSLPTYSSHLRDSVLVALFIEAGIVLGTLVTVYNYSSFRLLAAPYSLSQTAVGSVFGLYVFGFFSSSLMGFLSHRVHRLGLLRAGLGAMGAGVLATMMRPLIVIIIGIGLVTIGFFAAHSVASSWVSIRARQGTAQASALYLFFYYMGASIAGSVGGIFWSAYAWMGVATFLIALQVVAFGLTVARLSDKSG